MNTDADNYNTEIAFHCALKRDGCGARFKTKDYESEDYPEREWLKVNYYATCPKCGELAEQAAWQLAQWKAIHDHGQPGPVTETGKNNIRAAQKERDSDSYKISRFNAMTHGMSAKVADTYPARPGGYDECESCQWLTNGCGTAFNECLKKLEVFLQFHVAMKEGNGRLLGDLLAQDQAGLAAIRSSLIRSIAKHGVLRETPEWVYDKDTGIQVAEYTDEQGRRRQITKLEVNPGIKALTELIARNNTTLADMGLTPGVLEEEQKLPGYIDDDNRESIEALEQKINEGTDALRRLMGHRTIDGELVEKPKRLIDQAKEDSDA